MLIVLALGFVLMSLWLIGAFGSAPDHGLGWSGWIGLAFFGPAAVILIRRVSDRRPQIIADQRGLYWRQWSGQTIPWEEFDSIEVQHISGQRLLGLNLRDPDAHPPTTPLGKLARYNEQLGFAHVTLSAQGLDRSFDEMHGAFTHFLQQRRRG
jgi:hypothetical protein